MGNNDLKNLVITDGNVVNEPVKVLITLGDKILYDAYHETCHISCKMDLISVGNFLNPGLVVNPNSERVEIVLKNKIEKPTLNKEVG